jgi:hypothetical protein
LIDENFRFPEHGDDLLGCGPFPTLVQPVSIAEISPKEVNRFQGITSAYRGPVEGDTIERSRLMIKTEIFALPEARKIHVALTTLFIFLTAQR